MEELIYDAKNEATNDFRPPKLQSVASNAISLEHEKKQLQQQFASETLKVGNQNKLSTQQFQIL